MIRKVFTYLTLFASLCTLSNAQNGDGKEANSDILKSENWKEWGTDPIPVLSPEDSLKALKVAPGFKVELVASEPLIKDPVFAEWDSEGRLWVCEFRTYMINLDGTDENQRVSRVVVLEDTDGDGRMDKSTPFVDDLINPRTLSIVEGGVLVVESGKLWFCEDKDGDLRCEKKTDLMEFAKGALNNIEHAENSLHYAIDNWMYNSKSSRKVRWEDGKVVTANALSRGQWGMATDAYGRLFHNHNSIWFNIDWKIYDRAWPIGKKELAAPTKEVFPIHPTPALNRAYKPGMLNENGNPKSVTSISGVAVHSSGAYGEEWENAVFSFSPGTNTVGAFKTDKPFPETKSYVHATFDDAEVGKREFLASTDTRFRPVNGSFGPDGCLYVVDFYRGVIQHRQFLTSYLRNQSEVKELDKHIGLGRIYRVVPIDAEPVAAPENLVDSLNHKHLWWRLDGQQKIVEGKKVELADDIKKLATDDSASPFGRAHALWTLAGLNKLDPETVKTAIRDTDWFVSLTGLRLAGAATEHDAIFPLDLKPMAKEIANQKRPILGAYAEKLSTIGYPSRVVSNYKDKEAKWVTKDKKLLSQYRKGRELYATSCGACHQLNGKGLADIAPKLAGSDWVTGKSTRVVAVALHGVSGPIKVNGKEVTGVPPIMPGHSFMNDEQLANILTYARNAWGNQADAISKEEVAKFRGAHPTRFMPWTAEELDALIK
ncbi:MAG: c-type cytochrome [Verrucomicrobiales bacterium]|nr:c-type cytochrome [Verrucomicrobiales bacterium]